MNTIKPIFVMGTARSGTTWLSNLLESHRDISAISCVEHHGIHESHLFDHTRYCFQKELPCRDFIKKYKEEDYYKLLGVSEEEFCNGKESSGSVFQWFRYLMDDFAQREGASYWLEKTPKHVIYYDEILNEFPDALFIIIERGFRRTLLSNLTKYARPEVGKIRQIAEKVLRYESDRKALKRLCEEVPDRVLSIRYEELVSSTDKVIERAELFLKIPILPLKSRYDPDSSYKHASMQYNMSLMAWFLAYIIKLSAMLMPFELQRSVRMARDRKSSNIFPLYHRL